ncbi:MAG: hypothetical protein KAH67_09860, partial [Flavobacteriaceae bacterium]|nr:hypothetical protein [Flavobacteriaceae bacterium]
MNYYLGVDIGSTTIKIVLIDESGEMVDKTVSPTGSMFNQNALDSLDRLLKYNNLTRDDLNYIV